MSNHENSSHDINHPNSSSNSNQSKSKRRKEKEKAKEKEKKKKFVQNYTFTQHPNLYFFSNSPFRFNANFFEISLFSFSEFVIGLSESRSIPNEEDAIRFQCMNYYYYYY
jgi:hypothetical protein